MNIRLFESNDQQDVINIFMEHPLQFPNFVIERYPPRWEDFAKAPAGKSQYYVAYTDDNQIMGHAGYLFNDEVGLYEIVGVVVKKDFQRAGVGKALISTICSEMNELNEHKIILYTLGHEGNEDTLTFYRRIGFEVSNHEKDYFRSGYDRVTFIKQLG
ncbi:GNAT family N-acetyltransferase [Bacillus sp. FJAT-28004]|uniref:GNAT family N-acetyltransferase n=1 Tax=Bacillus sp. FJAT-28004 TaxID=1679165 RepID=UPI0006B4AAA3|nr:GNAT family N-acetyltransferase [Bacillus sp. FJAT-28004]